MANRAAVCRQGKRAAEAVVLLIVFYAAVLGIGLATVPDPASPIADPWFALLELLILALAPPLVLLFARLRAALGPPARRTASLSLACVALCAALTAGLHLAILAARLFPAAVPPALARELAFRWPSLAYALDILAWDVAFAFGLALAALALRETAETALLRATLWLAALLSLAGLSGVVTGDMAWRNIGIAGYVGVFAIAAWQLRGWFARGAKVAIA